MRIKGSGIHFDQGADHIVVYCALHDIEYARIDIPPQDLTDEKSAEILKENDCPECTSEKE